MCEWCMWLTCTGDLLNAALCFLRYYRIAYNHLLDAMYLADDRMMEFKMVAGFMNYKVTMTISPFHSVK